MSTITPVGATKLTPVRIAYVITADNVPPAEHHGGDDIRQADMDNMCELHNRDKGLVHEY